jgi:hypothetical protein
LEDQAARLIELEATVSELVNRPCECKNWIKNLKIK